MARTWDKENSMIIGSGLAERTASTQGLIDAIGNAPRWTLDDVITEMGGDPAHRNNALARELLAMKGNDNPTKKQIDYQMRSIQRWQKYESGVTGKQSAKPSKANQDLLNRAGRNAQAARDGFEIAMKGDIEVNGYRRPDRKANIKLSGERALNFLNNPNWQDLAAAYGAKSLHAFGDIAISINW